VAKVRCPICNARTTGDRGYTLCDEHGVIPYGWVAGELTHEKTLDMMSRWGIAVPAQAAKRRAKPDEDASAPDSTPAGVSALVNQLKTALNPADKRRIRAQLRRLGHKGGSRA
jgi:hypothetical protein